MLPIRENVNYKVTDLSINSLKEEKVENISQNNEKEKDDKTTIINNNYITVNSNINSYSNNEISRSVQDLSNPLISQVVFFSKMFQKFVETEEEPTTLENLKETIYKTYSKTVNNSINYKESEKSRMKMILDLLIHTQLKKIELKLEYFNEFERLMEFELSQMKTMESQLIQDRVRNSIKKIELNDQIERLKSIQIQFKNELPKESKDAKEKELLSSGKKGN